jgi:hypothetical protein
MNEQGTFGANASQPGGAAEAVKDEAQRLASDAKQETARVASMARDQATQLVDRTKDRTAQQLGSLATALRQAARSLDQDDAAGFGRYAGLAADQVDRAADYVGGKDLRELVRDTETFARRHPDLFLGGAFVAGVMLARFIRSSRPEPEPSFSGDLRYQAGGMGQAAYGSGETAGSGTSGSGGTGSI